MKLSTEKSNRKRFSQEQLGKTVRAIRKAGGLSQVEMAALLKIHQSAYSRIETGFQALSVEQLIKVGEHFRVNTDSILTSRVNYWRISVDCGTHLSLPKRYDDNRFSRVRELFPLFLFTTVLKGPQFTRDTLKQFGFSGIFNLPPDSLIGVQANLDYFRYLISTQILTDSTFKKLIEQNLVDEVHDFLDDEYRTCDEPISLIEKVMQNAHHYQENFDLALEDQAKGWLEVSMRPADHMKNVSYKDDILGDILCRYRREYLAQFPRYIGEKPARLVEKECHFHGAERCVYRIEVA